MNFKTMHQFEPSAAFVDSKMNSGLQRVGEHPTFDSEEEVAADSESEDTASQQNSCPELMK